MKELADGAGIDYERDPDDPSFVRVVLRVPMPLTVSLPGSVHGPDALEAMVLFCRSFVAGNAMVVAQIAKMDARAERPS